jgi:hypothetical protein
VTYCARADAWCVVWVRAAKLLLRAGEVLCCSKIAKAEAAVSVNEKQWLVMHVHVQMRLEVVRYLWCT